MPTLDHLGLPVADLARSLAFYLHLLDGEAAELGAHTLVRAGEVSLALVPTADAMPFGQTLHLAIRFPGAEREAVEARLRELPHQRVGDRIYLLDPDGLVLELVFGD
ncbi:MAG: VOC family protein [Myxococcales bacterium]|nr:VOC family protein [Myxococcales bacterium]